MEGRKVYIIRHGLIRSNIENIYSGRSDEPLCPWGEEETHRLGRKMEGWGVQVIQSSPLARTIQTSEILNRYLKSSLSVNPDLIEMDLGPWTGLSKREAARQYPAEYRLWIEEPDRFHVTGMETLQQVSHRSARALDEILAVPDAEIMAMVTHAAVVKCVVLLLRELSLKAYHDFAVLNLSVYEVLFQNERKSLTLIHEGRRIPDTEKQRFRVCGPLPG